MIRGNIVILNFEEQNNYLAARSSVLMKYVHLRPFAEIKKVSGDIFIISWTIDFDVLTRGNPRASVGQVGDDLELTARV